MIICILIFVASAAFAVFLYKSIQKNYEISQETALRIEEFNSQVKNLKIFETFILDTAEEQKKMESLFVKQGDQDEFLGFVKELENAGGSIGLDINVESSSLAQNAGEKGPSLHLVAQGDFSQVFKYSMLLETLPYEISFESINFTKSDEGSWKGDYVIRLLSYEL